MCHLPRHAPVEELNLAFAGHEIVADNVPGLDGGARGTLPLAGLAEQFADLSLPGPRLRDVSPVWLHMLPMRPRVAVWAPAAAQRL